MRVCFIPITHFVYIRSTLRIGARYSYAGEEATLNVYKLDKTLLASYPLPAVQGGSIDVELQVDFDYELVVVEIMVPVSACNALVDMRVGIFQVKHTCAVDNIECPTGVDVCGTCAGSVTNPEECDDGTLFAHTHTHALWLLQENETREWLPNLTRFGLDSVRSLG